MPWKPQGRQFLKAGALKPAVRAARTAFRTDLYERFVTKLPVARKETMGRRGRGAPPPRSRPTSISI